MTLQQLEYIIAIDRYKNFSRAAESCFVTQATLSAMVKKLEIELQVILFDRKTSPVITSECGREIIDEAKKVIFQAEKLKDISRAIQNKVEGKLLLGILPTISSSLLSVLLKTLNKKFPLLSLTISEFTSEDLIKHLKEGSLDAGIMATPLKDPGLEEEILYYEEVVVYSSKPNKQKYVLRDKMLNEHVWLLEEGHCFREQSLKLCHLKEHSAVAGSIRFQANSFDTLLNLTDEMGGITLLPELYVNTLSRQRKARTARFSKPIPVREVSLVYHRPYAKLRLNKALAGVIRQTIHPLLHSNEYPKKDLSIMQF